MQTSELIQAGDAGNFDELMRANVREDIIACVVDVAERNNIDCLGVPLETDSQLRQLEMDGIIDAVMTADYDLLSLGCETIVYDLQFPEKGECNIFDQQTIFDELELTDEDFLYMCIFLGTDYICRGPHKMGEKKTALDKRYLVDNV